MRQYPDRLLSLIQKEEGNVQSVRNEANALLRRKKTDEAKEILDRVHPSNTGEGLVWGAYYDSRGYLTAGSGTLISKSKRGSDDEKVDIQKFKSSYGVDPFTMTKEQAKSLITIKLDENVNDYVNSKHGKDVDYDALPNSAKVAVGSLAYNVGGYTLGTKGKNYSNALKKAAASKSADDWSKFASQQKNFHGKNVQEPGVIKRRQEEAFVLDDLVYGQDASIIKEETPLMMRQPSSMEAPVKEEYDDVEDLFTPVKPEESSPVSSIINQLSPIPSAQAADENEDTLRNTEGDDVLPEGFVLKDQQNAKPDAPVNFGGTMLEDTRFQQNQEQINTAKAEEERPLGDSMKRFGDHVVNSFMTENIIGSTVKQAVVNWNVDTEQDNSFQPTQMLDYKELTKDIPNDQLKSVLENAVNAQQFRNRALGFQIEQKARQEMSEYMSANPISGFVGIGVASALDVTSFIPVSKLARLSGVTKSFKGVPLLVRNMGAQIAENVVQDLVQETILTSNSDIRKWDDGDILYGMVGGVVLGGVAGKFKTNAHLGKFQKLSQRMNMEKNLDGINLMIRSAERKGLGAKTVSELKQVRTVIEQSMQKEHQLLVMQDLAGKREVIAKGLKDNKRLDVVKQFDEFTTTVDNQVDNLKSSSTESKIQYFKTQKQEIAKKWYTTKTELNKQITSVNKELKEAMKAPKSSKADHAVKKITKELEALNKKLDKAKSGENYDLKKLKQDKTKFTRNIPKFQAEYTDDSIRALESSKLTKETELKKSLEEFDKSVDDGSHPEIQALMNTDNLNRIAKDLGLPESFKSVDDIDEFLGIKFDDSLSAARVRQQPSEYMKAQDVNEMFNKTDPELWNVVSRQFQESRDNPALGLASFQVSKDSATARLARATRLNELLTTESVVGRFTLNKSALKWSNNEFASAFYNWASPDGMGRLGGGKLSVIESQQMLQATYGGELRTIMNDAMDKLNPLIMSNKQFRSDLDLPNNDLAARLMMTEAYFPEKLSNLLRDEMITNGTARLKYGDEVGNIVDSWRAKFNSLSAKALKEAKEAGVVGTDVLEETADWFHRSWDNRQAIQFDIAHGTKKMEELIDKGMREFLLEQGKEISEKMATQIASQAKKFAYGLRSKDTRVFMSADTDYQKFMRKLLDSDTDGALDADVLKKEIKRIETNTENAKAKELARRKPISLTASIELADGSTFQLRDLLENNIMASQSTYLSSMAGRTAAARNGISDVNLLDEWVDRAVELERRRGNLDHADYIERSMREDVEAVKYGYAHREGNIDGSISRLQKMAMKYNAARLMQYTGISSIAEMNTLIAEAGYKAVGQVIANNAVPLLKSYLFGGVTGKVFRDTMYDELSVVSGVGFEDISFDALLSSSRMITASKVGNAVERVVDNAAKLTRRATGHVETTGRRLALNSLAINYGNIALGRDNVGNLLGGLSNVNLVELGLADLVNGKAVKNDSWNDIMDAIRKNALDEDGKNAMESGKNIRQFDLTKWNLKTRQKFSEVLAQQANHILVNPDSTTAKLWHNTWWGSMFNQFRTFSNNAQSKVAGHNVTQLMQGYRMGEMAEFSKFAQKMFWGAALGKLSLVLYGSINNAGREDFAERMEPYMGVDDFRDWTKALGRSSAITGLDSAVDTMIGLGNLSGHMKTDPLFESSTIGQSRDRFNVQTTATGQLAAGITAVGTGVLKGDFEKAGKQALKMSPFRRQLGVNQLLNAMGVD